MNLQLYATRQKPETLLQRRKSLCNPSSTALIQSLYESRTTPTYGCINGGMHSARRLFFTHKKLISHPKGGLFFAREFFCRHNPEGGKRKGNKARKIARINDDSKWFCCHSTCTFMFALLTFL